jgi:hypothetical protein
MTTAGHREPYDSRESRTVTGARGGETSPRDSPTPPVLDSSPQTGGASPCAATAPSSSSSPPRQPMLGSRCVPTSTKTSILKASRSPTPSSQPSTSLLTRSTATGTRRALRSLPISCWNGLLPYCHDPTQEQLHLLRGQFLHGMIGPPFEHAHLRAVPSAMVLLVIKPSNLVRLARKPLRQGRPGGRRGP